MRNRLMRSGVACAALAILAAAPAARADGWGTVKGQVVFDGAAPAPEQLKVDKDQEACLAHGPLLSQKYVVDPKSKGVRWVIVWLADPKSPQKGPSPIAPALTAIKDKKIFLDQPTCQFEPHVIALRKGQALDAKNTAKVPHNIKIDSGPTGGVNLNQIIAPGSHLLIPAAQIKPTGSAAISVSCTIHGWMKGYIRVFDHPYFAVTDAEGNFEIKDVPAGTWNLIAWQEEKGWVTEGAKAGTPVTVTADGVTNVGAIPLKP
jgi:hypothetical protein